MKEGDEAALQAYLEAFNKLKERKTLKEVLEREMLLAFIQANVDRIAEFPLLETEQNGIIKLVNQRAMDHPCQDYIKGWLGDFLLSLNHYAKAVASGDEETIDREKATLINAETILIQCVQGIVYAVGLAKDNASHGIISLLGAGYLDQLQQITQTIEPDETFWRAIIDQCIIDRIDKAYEAIVAEKKYSLSKDEKLLIMRFKLEDVLRHDGAAPVDVDLTRIQQSFEKIQTDDTGRKRFACVRKYLVGSLQAELGKGIDESQLAHAAQIVCMDDLSGTLCEMLSAPPANGGEELEKSKIPKEFVEEQIKAMATGAFVAISIIKQDMLRAMKELGARELKVIAEVIKTLHRQAVKPTLLQLYEYYFYNHLREQAGEDGGRLQFHSLRHRRVPATAMEEMSAVGMNRIRQKKFFAEDPDSQDMLLLKPKSASELQQLLKLFQAEEALVRKVLLLWREADQKIDILAAINLPQLAKVTTNLTQRLSEILSRMGLAAR